MAVVILSSCLFWAVGLTAWFWLEATQEKAERQQYEKLLRKAIDQRDEAQGRLTSIRAMLPPDTIVKTFTSA